MGKSHPSRQAKTAPLFVAVKPIVSDHSLHQINIQCSFNLTSNSTQVVWWTWSFIGERLTAIHRFSSFDFFFFFFLNKLRVKNDMSIPTFKAVDFLFTIIIIQSCHS